MGSDHVAQLNLTSTDPALPARIKSNSASADGGGIYLGRAADAFGQATLMAGNASIEDNIAPQGAAISVRESAGAGAGVFFNTPGTCYNGCPVGKPCGSISGNAAIAVSANLIAADSDGDYVDLENTTIAGNAIGTDVVLRLRSNASVPSKLHRSIVWQPMKTTVHRNGDPLDLIDDLVSESNSIDGGGNSPNLIAQYPRFVDPAHGDYSLRAGSPAVDYTSSVDADGRDLYSNPRDVDLPVVGNVHGRRDLGAIERPALQPLVLDSDFDVDLRLWSAATAGVTTWDVTRNASGAAGSGSPAARRMPSARNR